MKGEFSDFAVGYNDMITKVVTSLHLLDPVHSRTSGSLLIHSGLIAIP